MQFILRLVVPLINVFCTSIYDKCSAVADVGDRLATIYVGRRGGGRCCAPFEGGAGSPSNTM